MAALFVRDHAQEDSMKKASLVLAMLFAFGTWGCAASSSDDKDTAPGTDQTSGDAALDTLPQDTLPDTLDQTGELPGDVNLTDLGDEDVLEDTDPGLDTVDTIQPVDTVQVDTVLGPAASCRAENGDVTNSCEYYWDTNPNVASKQDLCESTQRTWSLVNTCEAGALGYCEEPTENTSYYCYPVDGTLDADKIAFCQMGCGGTFTTL
jgi:hypothetical protein